MKQKIIATIVALLVLCSAAPAYAARTESSWLVSSDASYIYAANPLNALISGVNRYLNFGTFSGSSGYGIRDSGGVMQVKSSGGSWASICGSCAGSGNSAWTIGNGLIYNATSSDKVGVGLSSPIGQFDVFKTVTTGDVPSNTFSEDSGLLSTFSGGDNPNYDIFSFVNLGGTKVFSNTPYNDGWIVSSNSYSVYLNFGAVAGADGYRVFRDRNATGFFTEYADVATNQLIDSDYTAHAQSVVWKSTTGEAADAIPKTFNLDSLFNYNDGSTFYGLNTNGSAIVSKNFTANGSSSLADLYLSGRFADGSNATGTKGMVLQTTGTSTKWVATSTLGIVSSGGSGNSAFTIGNGTIFNATTSDFVGIGSSTPTATLSVQGTTTNPSKTIFSVASSSKTQYLVVLPNGNVGIGTSSPRFGLESKGQISSNGYFGIDNVSAGDIFYVNGLGKVGIGSSSLSVTTDKLTVDGGNININNSSLPALRFNNTGTGGRPWRILTGDTSDTSITGAFAIQDDTNSVYPLVISSADLIGIGTTSPSQKLSVAGNALVDGVVTASQFVATSSTASTFVAATVSGNFALTGLVTGCAEISPVTKIIVSVANPCKTFTVGNGTIFNSTSSDAVGVGNATPVATLDVKGNGAKNALIVASSSGTAILTVSVNGNVGIGSSTPTSLLVVNGTTTSNVFVGTSTTATSTLVNATIDNVELGNARFDDNAGAVTALDMNVTSAAANNTTESYAFNIKTFPILTVYSQSDGANSIKNDSIGIGSSTPTARLTVQGTSSAPTRSIFIAASSSNVAYFTVNEKGQTIVGGDVPTLATSTGSGTGGTGSVTGNANGGTITINTGTLPTGSNATIATITYPKACPTGSAPVMSGNNASAAALSGSGSPFLTGNTTTATLTAGSTGLLGSTTYTWNYYVICW